MHVYGRVLPDERPVLEAVFYAIQQVIVMFLHSGRGAHHWFQV